MTEELKQKAEEMIVNFFCGVRQGDYTHKETVRLMEKFATETTKELQKEVNEWKTKFKELHKKFYKQCVKDYCDLEKQNKELQEENKLLKSLLYCTVKTCDNCGNCNCENFQRQRKSVPCELYISYQERIKQLEKEDELSRKRIEKYKKDLKELRVAFIQAQAMALNGGKSFEDIIGQMQDITFGVSN